ncbi:MAG: AraC family transcriptional regulator [Bacteroidota bacterium]
MLHLYDQPLISPSLSPAIAYFYRFHTLEAHAEANFIHLPHHRNTINVFFETKVDFLEGGRWIRTHEAASPIMVVSNNRRLFRFARIQGKINGYGIVFHPLGINRFTKKILGQIPIEAELKTDDLLPGLFDIDPQLHPKTWNNDLEALLLEKFTLPNWGNLPSVVAYILEHSGDVQVAELADHFFINRRTLLRQFKKYLGCSVEQFKSVVRFRRAVDTFKQNGQKPSLTDLAHLSHYYDQSDFIHQFKLMAGGVPGKVLPDIQTVGNQDLYWLFPKSDKLSQ